MKVNHSAMPTAWVVDDFYEDPMAVREFALSQEFEEGGLGKYYIGRRTFSQFLFPGLKERFEKIMGTRIVKWEDHGMNGRFQCAYAGEPLVYHCDAQRWAAMIYLTPDAPFDTGTSLYAHTATGVRTSRDERIMEAFASQFFLDRTPYTVVDSFGNVFNRLVIMDAKCIHAATQYFGYNKENCRLWHMFFFD